MRKKYAYESSCGYAICDHVMLTNIQCFKKV